MTGLLQAPSGTRASRDNDTGTGEWIVKQAVKNPCLRIMGGAGNLPLWGYCSACENVKFAPTDELTDPNQQEQRLKYLFNQHFVKVHLHEDRIRASHRKSEKRRGALNLLVKISLLLVNRPGRRYLRQPHPKVLGPSSLICFVPCSC